MLMKKAVLLLAVFALAGPFVAAQKGTPKEKKDAHVVMEVDGSLSVMPAADVKDFKKGLKDQHKEAVKAHKEAKKAAKKEKRKFNDPAPKKKKVKNHGTFKTKALADEFVTKLMAKRDKKKS